MKRIILVAIVVSLLAAPSAVAAQPLTFSNDFNNPLGAKLKPYNPEAILQANPKAQIQPPKPAPVVYSVIDGDNLTKIGTSYNVEWQRLWAKNVQLTHPDVIQIGDQITIPEPSEQLSRAIPAVVSLPDQTPGVAPLGSYDASNTYDYGYCTWYVKSRRGASLPNMLGDAHNWYSRAASLGMAVGSTPRTGAVGTTTAGSLGHVVYVESVNPDGSVNISEMNYEGWGVVSRRTTSAAEFSYIY